MSVESVDDSAVRQGLRMLFREYDVDGNGHIDEDELWAMLTEVTIASGNTEVTFGKDDASAIMAALDGDGNGTLEEDEMVEWVMSGLARPEEERRSFAERGALAKRLVIFLLACGKLGKRLGLNTKTKSIKKPSSAPARSKDSTSSPALRAISEASSNIAGACELLQIQCGLRVLFFQFSSLKQGLDINAVKAFFQMIPKKFETIKHTCTSDESREIEMSLPNICNDDDAERVFRALDTDNSGYIDMDEWIQWFVAGSLRDPEQQMAFAKKSAFNLRLTHLLRVVISVSQKLLPSNLVGDFCDNIIKLYRSALRKGMETLPEKDMIILMENIKSKMSRFQCSFTAEDAKKIHKALDRDGDRVVTEIEFASWILRGIALSFSERKRFAAKSALNMRMTNFLEAVCIHCGGFDLLHGMTMSPEAKRVENLSQERLVSGLKMLFDQFDTDSSGVIDENELKAMMIDLPLRFYVDPKFVPKPEDVEVVMAALDKDGNGEIDYNEWKEWILANRALPDDKRKRFIAKSPAHARLDKFVETIVHITNEMMAPLGGADELRPGLVEIFNMSAVEGKVGAKEVKDMVMKLTAKHPEAKWFECTTEMAKTLTDALDADGNGSVELEEWVTWILRGAQRPALERAKFAAYSDTFMLLTKFLEAISFVARKLTLFAHSH